MGADCAGKSSRGMAGQLLQKHDRRHEIGIQAAKDLRVIDAQQRMLAHQMPDIPGDTLPLLPGLGVGHHFLAQELAHRLAKDLMRFQEIRRDHSTPFPVNIFNVLFIMHSCQLSVISCQLSI